MESGFPRSGDVIHPQLWESGSGYETRGGGGWGRFRSDIRKVGGGGGGGGHSASGPIPLGTQIFSCGNHLRNAHLVCKFVIVIRVET